MTTPRVAKAAFAAFAALASFFIFPLEVAFPISLLTTCLIYCIGDFVRSFARSTPRHVPPPVFAPPIATPVPFVPYVPAPVPRHVLPPVFIPPVPVPIPHISLPRPSSIPRPKQPQCGRREIPGVRETLRRTERERVDSTRTREGSHISRERRPPGFAVPVPKERESVDPERSRN